MKKLSLVAAAGLASIACGPAVASLSHALPVERLDEPSRPSRRGKGKQAKPRKRQNMRTVSKRVRRKHRRTA